MTPNAFKVRNLMELHYRRSESVSASELASEARITPTELCTALEEVRESLIKDLWPNGLRTA